VAAKKLLKLELQPPRPMTRRISRRPAGAPVLVQSNHGERVKARIRDISVYGCSLLCDAPWLRSGSFVSIRLTSEWAIQTIVRWTRDGRCGVEFLRPISESEARAISED
jgi:hypothetical protein